MVNHEHRRVGNDVAGGIGAGFLFESFLIQLPVAVNYGVAGIGEEREIRRAAFIFFLAFHHLGGACDIIRAQGENLGGLLETLIQEMLQLT